MKKCIPKKISVVLVNQCNQRFPIINICKKKKIKIGRQLVLRRIKTIKFPKKINSFVI